MKVRGDPAESVARDKAVDLFNEFVIDRNTILAKKELRIIA